MRIWYRVSNLEAGRAFYRDTLEFTETFVDEDERWASLDRGATEIAIGETGEDGDDGEGQVATIDVADVKAERKRLAPAGGGGGGVLELHGAMRAAAPLGPPGHRR